jgi:uncharacterized membrane protein YbhN (UPF0104 family)
MRRLTTLVGVAVSVVGFAFVGFAIADQWGEAEAALEQASWGWLGAALVLALAAMVAIGLPSRRALVLVGGPDVGWRRTLAWFLPGQLGKYVPGAVWPVVGRAELAVRGGVGRVEAYSSVALSLATTNLGAVLGAALAFPFALVAEEGSAAAGWWVLLLLPLGALVVHPRVLRLVERLAGRALRRPELALVVPSWRDSAVLVLRHLPAWALVVAATWCTARALDPTPALAPIAFATLASWVAGMVVLPVPGGLGVREATFAALASTALPVGVAATVAVLARLVFMLADAAGVAVAVPLARGQEAAAGATTSQTVKSTL